MDEDNREIYDKFMELLLENEQDIIDTTATGIYMASEPLPLILTYHEVETMALHLLIQLKALEARGTSLLFWQTSDILFVNKKYYFLANLEQLVPFKKGKNPSEQIVLNYPAIYPFPSAVCAPELLQMTALPFITCKSVSYYSLALLCLAKLNLSLETLQGTKLFYFLERCLKDDPTQRLLIL